MELSQIASLAAMVDSLNPDDLRAFITYLDDVTLTRLIEAIEHEQNLRAEEED